MAKTSDFIPYLHNEFIAECIWQRLYDAMEELRRHKILTMKQTVVIMDLARYESLIPRGKEGALLLPQKEIVCVLGSCSERMAKTILEKLENHHILNVVDTLVWKERRRRKPAKTYQVNWDEIDRLSAIETARRVSFRKEIFSRTDDNR